MSSKRRIRRKQCESKKRYSTREEAERAIAQIFYHSHGYPGKLNVYHCKFCGGWHVGHMKGSGIYRNISV